MKHTKSQIEKMNKNRKEGEPQLLYYLDEIIAYLKKRRDQVGIIYVLSRNEAGSLVDTLNNVENTSEILCKEKIKCAYYHAGMTPAQV